MHTTLMAAFADRTDADNAVTELEEMGYAGKDISFITSESKSEVHKVAERSDDAAGDVAEGAVSGATTGGAIGGLAGLLAGAGVVPALAGLMIGGPVAVALGLTGVAATTVSGAVTGALAGGLIGGLTNLGLSEEEATTYEHVIKEGGVALAVPLKGDDEGEVRGVLEDNNATSVKSLDIPSGKSSE